jgi:hypothetical protein
MKEVSGLVVPVVVMMEQRGDPVTSTCLALVRLTAL